MQLLQEKKAIGNHKRRTKEMVRSIIYMEREDHYYKMVVFIKKGFLNSLQF